jgi:hypothetical protein
MENVLDDIKKCAPAFLYIFINPNAGLNKTIMKKRERQITLLRRIATSADISYVKAEKAVHEGIVEMFGKEPAEVLEDLYAGASVGNTEKSIWDNIADILGGVDKVLKTTSNNTGSNNTNTNTNKNTFPSQSDWSNQFSIMSMLPYIVAGGIVFYLFSRRK